MSGQRYTPEFKDEVARQVIERGYSVGEVSQRIGISKHSLSKWVNAVKPNGDEEQAEELALAKREIPKPRADMGRLEAVSMSRRGNCWDNAVAESFFSSFEKERIRRRSYKPAIWRKPIFSITSKCSTINPVATASSAMLVQRPLNRPHFEARRCL